MERTPQSPGSAMDLTSSDGRTSSRRKMLVAVGGGGLGLLAAACASKDENAGGSSATSSTATSTTADGASSSTTSATGDCAPIPEETAGPFPGDGSNGPDVLAEDGVVRSDIRSSIGSASGVAEGVPLTITLTVTDTSNGCAPLAGAAVYLWHCDREGRYSMYSQGVTNENYLRGVQETDASGQVTFISVFPACYDGRWPHAHFEVYPDVAAATGGRSKITTSQLALPEDVCSTVYASDGYSSSVRSLSRVSLASDNVFGDDEGVHELATVTGSVAQGYTATLAVPV